MVEWPEKNAELLNNIACIDAEIVAENANRHVLLNLQSRMDCLTILADTHAYTFKSKIGNEHCSESFYGQSRKTGRQKQQPFESLDCSNQQEVLHTHKADRTDSEV